MGNITAQEFAKNHFQLTEVRGKSIIEVGSLIVNYSVRPIFETYSPSSYLGIDIKAGRGVDQICNAESILTEFGPEYFDILISNEVLEHVKNWKKIISNFKNIIKPKGKIFISTRSKGFDYHGYPYDFWRFELDDMKEIFSDFTIDALEPDKFGPGLLLKATKPEKFKEKNLEHLQVYSIISRRKIQSDRNALPRETLGE